MGNYINIGNGAFAAALNGTYIDKTGLISYMNRSINTLSNLTCVTRPRRFGKTLTAQMLCAYYDRSCDSRKLFEELEISRDASFESHLNKYDVIFLDITEFTSAVQGEDEVPLGVKDIEKKVIDDLRAVYPETKATSTLSSTINTIVENTGRKFIMIIDEWDAFFREEPDNRKLQEDYIKLLRQLFQNSSKTQKMFALVYMTGILPIKKYAFYSPLSDFWEYTMIYPGKVDQFFGFTEEEVRRLCVDSNLPFSDMQRWYDGYVEGDQTHIYNPFSVMNAVLYGQTGSYWAKAESVESLRRYIEMDLNGLQEAIVQLLAGVHVRTDIYLFRNDMGDLKYQEDVLTLLVHLGFLTYDPDEEAVFIPNWEVKQKIFLAASMGKDTLPAKVICDSDCLLEATLDRDEESVAAAVEKVYKSGITRSFSWVKELVFRTVIRAAYIFCVKEYLEAEELPSVQGITDVVYIPNAASHLPLLVVELKWEKTAEGAIIQIKNGVYPQVMKEYAGEILLVGISYDSESKKFSCRIEEHRKEA